MTRDEADSAVDILAQIKADTDAFIASVDAFFVREKARQLEITRLMEARNAR